ncbi:MAG: hypothetical protein EXR17_06825 [Flavobacteriaceae bacterium]|nr:hypothetical protein [Flavobacteriaceae bacterium]
MQKKPIYLSILFFFLICLSVGYFLWHEPAEVKSGGKPDYEKNMLDWVKSLDADSHADQTFLAFIGKSVRFSAVVTEIKGDSSITLQLESGKEGFLVDANFDVSMKKELGAVLTGDSVTLQCECNALNLPQNTDDLFSEKVMKLGRCNLLKLSTTVPDLSKSHEHDTISVKSIP